MRAFIRLPNAGAKVTARDRNPDNIAGRQAPLQRFVHAENEANYCAKCQTGGRLLADRSLSRLLKDNWPKRLEGIWSSPAGTASCSSVRLFRCSAAQGRR